MSSHFLLSARARTLSLAMVLRMSDAEAEEAFVRIRWADGKPVCPHCACATVYQCRKPSGALRWRCKACVKDFSVTSGTLFAFHKMPLRNYLAAIAIFCNEVKGKSALALSRDLGVQYKTAFVLAHKLREAMASEMRGHAGWRRRRDGRDRRHVFRRLRQAAQPPREPPRSPPGQEPERQASGRCRGPRARRPDPAGGVPLRVRGAGLYRPRVARHPHRWRTKPAHGTICRPLSPWSGSTTAQAYSLPGGIYTNGAESFFSRMRRAEIGHHHHIAGPYLVRYAQEAAWREDHRRVDNGKQVRGVMGLAMACAVRVTGAGIGSGPALRLSGRGCSPACARQFGRSPAVQHM